MSATCLLTKPSERCARGWDHISFNGRFRDECLSVEWFRSRREAKVIIETWPQHYNAVRAHSSLDYLTPIELRVRHESINQGAVPK
jgi:putative transposase